MPLIKVKSEITGTVWKIVVREGDSVSEDDVLMILESMKMEIPLTAPEDGVIKEILARENAQISEGDVAAILQT